MRGKLQYCPTCGKPQDAHTPVDQQDCIPQEGDLSVCLYCATFCTFDDTLTLKAMTAEQIKEIQKKDPEAYAMMIAAESIIKKKIKQN